MYMLDLNPNPNCQAANPTFLTTEAHDKGVTLNRQGWVTCPKEALRFFRWPAQVAVWEQGIPQTSKQWFSQFCMWRRL